VPEDVFERHFVAHANGQREPAIEFGGLGFQQRGGDGRDGDGGSARGQPPQADGALLGDFSVRGQALVGQDVERGN
jgi:hypothetical protein